MPTQLTGRFEGALAFAARLHRNHPAKGSGVPYVSHLLGVASLVIEHGGDEDEAIAALLHDAIEDQGGPTAREMIRRLYGERVADIVQGCSDSDGAPKPKLAAASMRAKREDWKARKLAYLKGIPGKSPSVRLVTTADKLHNARRIIGDYREVGEELWDRFIGGREGTLWYYRSLVEAFLVPPDDGRGAKTGRSPLVNELERVVAEIERLAARPAHGRTCQVTLSARSGATTPMSQSGATLTPSNQ